MNKLLRNTLDNCIPQKKILQQIVVSQNQENAMIAGFNFSTDLSFIKPMRKFSTVIAIRPI